VAVEVLNADTGIHEMLRKKKVGMLDQGVATTPVTMPVSIQSMEPRVSMAGGESDSRNKNIQDMFRMIGAGERQGFGIRKIVEGWNSSNWKTPRFVEIEEPTPRVVVTLDLVSLFAPHTIEILAYKFKDKWTQCSEEEKIALILAYNEGAITHSRLSQFISQHPRDIMITVTKGKHTFEATLILGESKNNIMPFRKLCEKLGASACIVAISTKKDIDFDKKEHIIASTNKKTLLKELDSNVAVKAIMVPEAMAKDATKTCDKPVISTKNADITITPEATPKGENIIKITKQVTPEDLNALLTKTDAKALVIGEIALSQPVIFEQTTNYFEKGYYNKITRKRREKTLAEFEKIIAKFPSNEKIQNELKELIGTD
jgi:hypothetical protein